MAIHIFPYLLVRYASLPFGVLETTELSAPCLHPSMLKEVVCEELFQAISTEQDSKRRQQLLQAKRNFFNDKYRDGIPGYDSPACRAYFDMLDVKREFSQTYDDTLTTHRKALQLLAGNELLRKGILLSSPVLYEQLDSFAVADPAAFKKRELKNEYSLLRYISRMAAKTSPFSTFTHTGMATFQKTEAGDRSVQSAIRIHNGVYTYLHALMVHHPELNEQLPVKLNSTLMTAEDTFHFLLNHYNVEAIQRLPARSMQQWVYEYVGDRSLPLHELVNAINDDRVAVKAFIQQLIAFGFLEVNPLPLPEFAQLLHRSAAAFQYGNARQRATQLHQLSQQVNHTFTALQTGMNPVAATPSMKAYQFQPRKFLPQDILFEDTYTTHVQHIPHEQLRPFTTALDQLCNMLAPYDTLQAERERMKTFFLSHYEGEVPVTSFYHDYYLHVKKVLNGQKVAPADEDIPLPAAVFESDQVRLHIDTVHGEHAYSRGAFVQFYENEGKLSGVVNNLLPGMGKVAGRFLQLLPAAVTASFVQWNTDLYKDHLLMELSDGSAFNANIHPPLLSYEICIPGGHNNYPAEQQIALKDITVSYEQATDSLRLFHQRLQKPLYAFDLSLESFYNRSNCYQLLAHFNTDQRLPLQQLIKTIDRRYAGLFPGDGIVQLPAIVCNELVVLRRKGWLIPTAAIPVQTSTAGDYYLQLHDWLREHQLPTRVFLYLKSAYTPASNTGKLHRDDYKPQFINFNSPLMMTLFQKLLSRANEWIHLEEMLPAPQHLQEDTVTEHLIHWYNYED